MSEGIDNLLTNLIESVKGHWQPSYKFARGCQRVLATLWHIPIRIIAIFQLAQIVRGLSLPSAITVWSNRHRAFSEGLPYLHLLKVNAGGNLFCNTSAETQKLKYKSKTVHRTLQTMRGSSPNFSLSMYVTYRLSKSCETVLSIYLWPVFLIWISIKFAEWIWIHIRNADPDPAGNFCTQNLTFARAFSMISVQLQ